MRYFKSLIFRKVSWVCLVLFSLFYFSILFYIVFGARRRSSVDHQVMRSYVNLVPVRNMYAALTNFKRLAPHESYNSFENILGNILLFVPLPLILAYITRLKSRNIFFICVLTSISIEITQYILGIGIADVDDVILNSLGALLGLGVYGWLKKRRYAVLL